MAFEGFPEQALDFYEGLEADNSKAYWTDHKHVYDGSVRAPLQALLEELAGGTDVPPETARRLRSLREAVSVHLSAAASLRLLDLDAKAAAVLRRAVESVQPAVITFVTQGKPVAVA